MKKWMWVALIGLGLALGSGAWLMAGDGKGGDDGEKEEKVALEQCPKAVQDTLKKEAGDNKIGDIEKETEKDGTVVYEADVTIDGKEWEIKVAADGKLLKKKIEDDDEKGNKDEDDDDKDEDHADED